MEPLKMSRSAHPVTLGMKSRKSIYDTRGWNGSSAFRQSKQICKTVTICHLYQPKHVCNFV